MSQTLNVNGVNYSFPDVGEENWGQNVTNWAVAITAGALQKKGGTFTLTAEVDFGATYGVKTAYVKSKTADISTVGVLRLANQDSVGWRNAAGAANLELKPKAAADGILTYGGLDLVDVSSAQNIANKTFTGSTFSGTIGGLTVDRALVSDGSGNLVVSPVTSTELAHLGGVTSAVLGKDQAGTFTQKTIAAGSNTITGLANANIDAAAAIAYSKLNLSASIVNDDVNASAAIAYSKLNLGSSVVDADINGAAAIALAKLAALTVDRALVSNGAGVIAVSAVTAAELAHLSGVTSALQTQLDAKASSASLSSHTSATTSVHGIADTSLLLTTTGAQVVTNKTIGVSNQLNGASAASLTVAGGYVLSMPTLSGNDTALSRTSTDTVLNKTFTAPAINGANLNFGTATNTNRLLLPSETTANLGGLNNVAGLLSFDSSQGKAVVNDGTGWKVIGSGGEYNAYTKGDAEGASTADFVTGNNAIFDNGGTAQGVLSVSTTAGDIIDGLKVFKLVGHATASNNTNDFVATTPINIPQGLRGRVWGIKFSYRWDGTSNNIRWVVKDTTNGTILTLGTEYLTQYIDATYGTSKDFSMDVFIPASCAQIEIGPQVILGESSKVLIWDNVVVTPDPFVYKNLTDVQVIRHQAGNNTLLDSTNEVRFSIGGPISSGASILSIVDDAAGTRTKFVALRKCVVDVAWTASIGNAGNAVRIYKNGTYTLGSQGGHSYTTNASSTVSASFELEAEEYLTVGTSSALAATADVYFLQIVAEAQTEHIVTPSQEFNSDVNAFSWTGTAITATSEIGKYNTYTYAINTNTQTLEASTRPTQTDADMNVNGMRLYCRPYNAASTAALPSMVKIQIGKGRKTVEINGFQSAGKITGLDLDYFFISSTTVHGIQKSYEESTGILTITLGYGNLGTVTSRQLFVTGSNASSADGYFTIRASSASTMVAVPTPQIAYVKDVKAAGTLGGTFTTGAWRTRDLNTVSGDSSMVSLSANQFTLGSGVYDIEAFVPRYAVVTYVKAKLKNVTDSTDDLVSTSGYCGVDGVFGHEVIKGRITLTSQKVFEIQHQCGNTSANGFGIANTGYGLVETYTVVQITKVR